MQNLRNEEIINLFKTYEKYGWKPYKVLLSTEQTPLGIFDGIPVEPSEINAAWFSRASKHERIAFELRLLASNQIALLETLDKNASADEIMEMLKITETKLSKIASKSRKVGD